MWHPNFLRRRVYWDVTPYSLALSYRYFSLSLSEDTDWTVHITPNISALFGLVRLTFLNFMAHKRSNCQHYSRLYPTLILLNAVRTSVTLYSIWFPPYDHCNMLCLHFDLDARRFWLHSHSADFLQNTWTGRYGQRRCFIIYSVSKRGENSR